MVLMEFLGVVLPWCCNTDLITGVVLEFSGVGTAVELNVDSSGLTAVLAQQWCW